MKKLSFSLTIFALIVLSSPALAGGYGHGYGYSGYGFRGHHGFRHHGGFRHFGGYGRYGRGGHAGYLVGGVLLGALLSQPRYVPPPVVVAAPAAPPPVRVAGPASVSRRLLRDINGQCFERRTKADGSELRIELPAAECNW